MPATPSSTGAFRMLCARPFSTSCATPWIMGSRAPKNAVAPESPNREDPARSFDRRRPGPAGGPRRRAGNRYSIGRGSSGRAGIHRPRRRRRVSRTERPSSYCCSRAFPHAKRRRRCRDAASVWMRLRPRCGRWAEMSGSHLKAGCRDNRDGRGPGGSARRSRPCVSRSASTSWHCRRPRSRPFAVSRPRPSRRKTVGAQSGSEAD